MDAPSGTLITSLPKCAGAGTERDTFLIDPEGNIVRVWRKVSVKGHAEEVRGALLDAQKEK